MTAQPITELWFARDVGDVHRWGTMLYASAPGEVWAIARDEPVYVDLAQESDQLRAHYGAFVEGIGYGLFQENVPLPPRFEKWAAERDVPAARIGPWIPRLISIDGAGHLALSRDYEHLRVFATTSVGQHLTILAPAAEPTVTLVHRELDVEPPGWGQSGGVRS